MQLVNYVPKEGCVLNVEFGFYHTYRDPRGLLENPLLFAPPIWFSDFEYTFPRMSCCLRMVRKVVDLSECFQNPDRTCPKRNYGHFVQVEEDDPEQEGIWYYIPHENTEQTYYNHKA